MRSDSSIVFRRHDEQFSGHLWLGGQWRYSQATLEWKKTDGTVSTYSLDTIGTLLYLIPKTSDEEHVRRKEQIAACVKDGPSMKEMASCPPGGTPEEKRSLMQRFEYSDARGCVCGTDVLVETPEFFLDKSEFKGAVTIPKPRKKK